MKNMTNSKRPAQRWFNIADVLIVIIALAMLAGAAVLFLFPDSDMVKEYTPVNVTLLISVDDSQADTLAELEDKDRIYCDGTDMGFVITKDLGNGTVLLDVNIQYSDGVYYIGEAPLRVNGSVTVETKLVRLEGTVIQILNKEG